MKVNLNDGDAYIEGRSAQKAQELLEKAEAAGLTGRIRTTSFGYIVPAELVEGAGEEPVGEIAPVVTEAEKTVEDPAKTEGEGGDGESFDPTDATVEEVIAYLDNADEAEVARVLAAEEASAKPRKGILSYEAEGDK